MIPYLYHYSNVQCYPYTYMVASYVYDTIFILILATNYTIP